MIEEFEKTRVSPFDKNQYTLNSQEYLCISTYKFDFIYNKSQRNVFSVLMVTIKETIELDHNNQWISSIVLKNLYSGDIL